MLSTLVYGKTGTDIERGNMGYKNLSDEELLEKKKSILQEIKTLPAYSLHRKDLLKAIDRIEKERVRRAWRKG